jgi:peptidoglycan/LPS O-acetylase OafA/YrhL
VKNKQRNIIDFRLSLNDSLLLKGIAICLMLWHHLFYQNPEYGALVFQTAQFAKVCVSLFLFVSAYGLTVQYGKIYDKPVAETFKFQVKRFVKFYANYWSVFLIFVPVGVLFFSRSFSIPYGNGITNQIKMLITDFSGLNLYQSYNITWWFNQLIICMYILFPALYFIAKKQPVFLLTVSVFLWIFNLPVLPAIIHNYLFIFSLGIVYSLNIGQINSFLNRINRFALFGLLLTGVLILFYVRNHATVPLFSGTRVDAFLTLNIVCLGLLIIRTIQYNTIQYNTIQHIKPLIFLGKHSMNIYMVHTFIYYYFFMDFMYSFKYPVLIFVVLLLCSLAVSIIVEYLKKAANLSKLINNINRKIEEIKS